MKTITKKYNLYSFEELGQEAKDKAREAFNADNDYPFLTESLTVQLHDKLVKLELTEETELKIYYSLSCSQGDGLMFEGTLSDKKGNKYTIEHSGYYYHEQSTSITGKDKNGEDIDTEQFEQNTYIPLCRELADIGYKEIEYQDSEEYFAESCEANEYTFLEDGTMFNA